MKTLTSLIGIGGGAEVKKGRSVSGSTLKIGPSAVASEGTADSWLLEEALPDGGGGGGGQTEGQTVPVQYSPPALSGSLCVSEPGHVLGREWGKRGRKDGRGKGGWRAQRPRIRSGPRRSDWTRLGMF